MVNRVKVAGLLVATSAVFITSYGLAQKERATQPFMRQKLGYAQGILEGITLEKFDLVVTNATQLRNMNLTNVFLLVGNPSYLERTATFQKAVDDLKAAARDKSVARSAEAYSQITASCIDCHQFFRKEQIANRKR